MNVGSSFSGLFVMSGGVAFNNMVPWQGGHLADVLAELLPCLLIDLFSHDDVM